MSRLDAIRPQWSALAEASGNVFATWEFAEVWWRLYGGSAEWHVELVQDEGGAPVAVLPLVLHRHGPVRLLRFLGHGPSDQLGPICAPPAWRMAAERLRDVLARGGWDVFAGELLPRDGAWDALDARVGTTAGSPVLHFPSDDWDAYLRTRSSNFRQLVRRKARKVDAAGGTFRLATAETLPDDLETLFALHRERWARGGSSGFVERADFHRAFASIALGHGWLRLWILEIGGEPAAAWYGFRYAGAESYYQAGRARRFDDLSVGLVLLAHTIRSAQQDGMTEYRFLRGDEPFKYRFTDVDPGLVTLVRSRGALGRAALASVLAGRRARQAWDRIASRKALRSAAEMPTTHRVPAP